jgi:predicted amino acid-binding ACT domain protein
MTIMAKKADMWAGAVLDRPGSLAKKLAALAAGGANPQFVLARRAPEEPGMGVLFVAGIEGVRQQKAARAAGMIKTKKMSSIRVEGPDRKGIAAQMSAALAEAGVNLRGLSAIAAGKRFVAFLALDSAGEAGKALRAIRNM